MFAFEIYGDFPGTFDIFDTATEAEDAVDAVNLALNGAGALSLGNLNQPGIESPIYNIGYESVILVQVEFVNVWRAWIEGADWVSLGNNQWTYNLDEKSWAVFTITTAVGDDAGSGVPDAFELFPNYPNPFNPSTTIYYALPEAGNVELIVYDVLGNEVSTLVNEEKPAGINEVEWNASNVPSGVYFYRLSADGFVQTRKMMLMK
ncbi:T9SS type A sorting domain-containing protein [Bacteroidota bacterium]